ncbi:hypothetical protein N0V83_007123 [Neocucurbitaria cava]|uniref:Uncharacterized protein n=1 Tax=Neocucurbitaria cava TaxID=798079 RepID=A0A9W8Y5Q0_9PLEO|nr:hypothetical protein N0V83_007123 [Neocucurbitaria cava]
MNEYDGRARMCPNGDWGWISSHTAAGEVGDDITIEEENTEGIDDVDDGNRTSVFQARQTDAEADFNSAFGAFDFADDRSTSITAPQSTQCPPFRQRLQYDDYDFQCQQRFTVYATSHKAPSWGICQGTPSRPSENCVNEFAVSQQRERVAANQRPVQINDHFTIFQGSGPHTSRTPHRSHGGEEVLSAYSAENAQLDFAPSMELGSQQYGDRVAGYENGPNTRSSSSFDLPSHVYTNLDAEDQVVDFTESDISMIQQQGPWSVVNSRQDERQVCLYNETNQLVNLISVSGSSNLSLYGQDFSSLVPSDDPETSATTLSSEIDEEMEASWATIRPGAEPVLNQSSSTFQFGNQHAEAPTNTLAPWVDRSKTGICVQVREGTPDVSNVPEVVSYSQ